MTTTTAPETVTALELAAMDAVPHRGYYTLHQFGSHLVVPPANLEGANGIDTETVLRVPLEECSSVFITMITPGSGLSSAGMTGLVLSPEDPVVYSYTEHPDV